MIGDLTHSQIEHLLQTAIVGRIGCHDAGTTYVVPISFVYQEGFIYGHSGIGQKVEMMRANPNICFEVDEIENLGNWRSAILWGVYEEMDTDEEREMGLRLLVERLTPFMGEESAHAEPRDGPDVGSTFHFLDRSSRHGVVFRFRITEMTGRYENRK